MKKVLRVFWIHHISQGASVDKYGYGCIKFKKDKKSTDFDEGVSLDEAKESIYSENGKFDPEATRQGSNFAEIVSHTNTEIRDKVETPKEKPPQDQCIFDGVTWASMYKEKQK